MSDCILWEQAVTTLGYGVTWHEGGWALAHRVAYEQHVGPLEDGKQVHHCCGERRCVNPDHLVQLSPAEHAAQHPEKAGVARRNGAVMRKLTFGQAQAIRRRHAAGESQTALAQEFGISLASMNALVHGRSYREEVMP